MLRSHLPLPVPLLVWALGVAVLTAPLSGGTASIVPSLPSSQTAALLRYHETDWMDSCPPTSVAALEIDGYSIEARLTIPFLCDTPTPGDNPYTALIQLPPLDPGTYTATVEAPDFHTGMPETDQVVFDVVPATNCAPGQRPSASLLLPYFENHLDAPEEQRTLFAIGTVANSDTLVHVVVWTNWGWPILSFDAVLPANGMKTFDIGAVLGGNIPPSSPPGDGSYPGCASPLEQPAIDPAAVRALFTGQPALDDGLCYSEPGLEPGVATGYVTVDVVRDCSGAQVVSPWDAGYFEEELAESLATRDNLLWGDFYLVSGAHDLAEGETLVALYADDELYGVPGDAPGSSHRSFYRDHDHRRPLGHSHRGRFLDGGSFDADTEILAWTEGNVGPTDCDSLDTGLVTLFGFRLFDEQGNPIAEESLDSTQLARRFQLGETNPLASPFGVIDMDATFFNGVIGVPIVEDLQSWMLPIVRAQDRFGVAAGSMPLEDFCRP